jgi:outer membrane protein TolC
VKAVGFLLAACCSFAAAQPKSLAQLYAQSVAAQPGVQAAEAARQAAAARVDEVRAQGLPQVNLSLARQENRVRQYGIREDYFGDNQTLGVRQPLFRADLSAATEQAQSVLQEAQWRVEQVKREFATQLAQTVLSELLAAEQLALSEVAQQTAQELLRAAQQGFSAGVGVRTDVDEARAQLAVAAADAQQARMRLAQARQLVTRLSGVAAHELARLRPADDWSMVDAARSSSELLLAAEPVQTQLAAARARIRSAELELKRVSRSAWPRVDAVASWQHSRSENVFNPQGAYRHQQLGLELNWPIYQGGRVDAAVREAQAKRDEAVQQLAALRLDVLQRIESAQQLWADAPSRVSALRRVAAFAQEALRSSRLAYRAGSRALGDVAQAAQRAQLAQRNLAEARMRALMAYVQLSALVAPDMAEALQALAPWFEPFSVRPNPPAGPHAWAGRPVASHND